MIQLIDRELLDNLRSLAASNPRKRQNYNLHSDYSELCQRLLNALEPGTYVRPHRHLHPPKSEGFIAVRGRFAAVIFNGGGELHQIVEFSPQSEVIGLDIPPGAWHSILALASGSIFYETKPGPYEPLSDKDFPLWAPAEQSPEAAAYLEELERRVRIVLAKRRD